MKKIIFTLIVGLLFFKSFGQTGDENTIKTEIEKLHKKTEFVRDSISKLLSECNNQLKISTNDSVTIHKLNYNLENLWNSYDGNLRDMVKINLEFAKRNPNSLLALKLILSRISSQEGMGFYDTYEAVFNNFSTKIKETDEGKEFAEKLKNFKQSKIGSFAPEFTVKDINGNTFSLNDFRNKKYILIDFWASWCGPCREELPYIKDLFKKYNQNGFEIISVSRDEDLSKWKSAILKEEIAIWKQISIVENDNSIEKKYFVFGIPHKVLIDRNGIVIGKWKGSGDKNKRELQHTLSEIFDKK